jgi:hypothetical protein
VAGGVLEAGGVDVLAAVTPGGTVSEGAGVVTTGGGSVDSGARE